MVRETIESNVEDSGVQNYTFGRPPNMHLHVTMSHNATGGGGGGFKMVKGGMSPFLAS